LNAGARRFSAARAGAGDREGENGGYDVQNYSLKLDYTPSSNSLVATAVITARATQSLSSFISTCAGSTFRGCS